MESTLFLLPFYCLGVILGSIGRQVTGSFASIVLPQDLHSRPTDIG